MTSGAAHLVQVVLTTGQEGSYNKSQFLDLVRGGPLSVAGVLVYAPDIFADLGRYRLEQKIIERVQGVTEDQLRPREDPEFITKRVKVISSG